jgi:large subunit ribosomal protein L23
MMKDPHDIIKRPVITESATRLMEERVYVFEVDGNANKIEIAKAVEAVFDGVKVLRVNTMWVPAKSKRFGKHSGFTSKWKKAMVKFSEDSTLPEYFS